MKHQPAPDYFVLASTSPRRRQFLEILGIPFTAVAPGASGSQSIDETPHPGETPSALVQRLSRKKARSVLERLPACWPAAKTYSRLVVVAADTEVVLAGQILGKPANAAEAAAMLRQLRNRPHQVYSGLTVAQSPQILITRLHTSQVWIRSYTDNEIDRYIDSGSPLDKAGAYGIQDVDFAPVARLDGCFASVMGFPLGEFSDALHELGLALPDIGPLCRGITGYPCCRD